MRVVVCHTAQYHPLAKASHDRLKDIEQIDVSGRPDAYQHILCELWKEKETFLLIEHDIEVTTRAIHQAKFCSCLWGTSPYNGPGHDPLIYSLGFVRFRKELMERHPSLMQDVANNVDSQEVPAGHWKRIDARLKPALIQAGMDFGIEEGYRPHVHDPVLQHHVYNSKCACDTDHDPFPIDVEGRYRPQ